MSPYIAGGTRPIILQAVHVPLYCWWYTSHYIAGGTCPLIFQAVHVPLYCWWYTSHYIAGGTCPIILQAVHVPLYCWWYTSPYIAGGTCPIILQAVHVPLYCWWYTSPYIAGGTCPIILQVVPESGRGWQLVQVTPVAEGGEIWARVALDYENPQHREGLQFTVQVTDQVRKMDAGEKNSHPNPISPFPISFSSIFLFQIIIQFRIVRVVAKACCLSECVDFSRLTIRLMFYH